MTMVKGYPETPCMYDYKEKIQSDGSFNKLKLIIVVRGDFQNKQMTGNTWSPSASMSTLKYFSEDSSKRKSIVHQSDFIEVFLQANGNHRISMKLDKRYG